MGMPWSPMSALSRISDTEAHVYDDGFKVAIIRRVQIKGHQRTLWRSVTGETDSAERHLIGYFPTIQLAAHVTWRTWTQRKTPAEQRHV